MQGRGGNWSVVRPTDPPTHRPTDPPTHRPTDPPAHRPTDLPTYRPTDLPTYRPTSHLPPSASEMRSHVGAGSVESPQKSTKARKKRNRRTERQSGRGQSDRAAEQQRSEVRATEPQYSSTPVFPHSSIPALHHFALLTLRCPTSRAQCVQVSASTGTPLHELFFA
jgi:hypothetical protein